MIFIVLILSLVTLLYFFNKEYYILAGCKRIKTVDGRKLEDCVGILKGVSIFGNNLDLTDLNPEKLFSYGRSFNQQHKANFLQYFLLSPVLNVNEPHYAELVLNNQNLITKGTTYNLLEPFLGTGLLISTGKKWHFRRRLLTPAFHFNILQKFLDTFKDEATKFLNVMQNYSKENQNVVISEEIPKFTLNNVCETALGVNMDDINQSTEYRHNVHESEELYLKRVCNPIMYYDSIYERTKDRNKYFSIVEKLHKFSSNVIETRRKLFKNKKPTQEDSHEETTIYFKKERHAMLDTLLSAETQNLIDHQGICEEVDTFMFEGFDTTSIGLMFTVLLLSLHEDVQQKCFEEISNRTDDLSTFTIQDFNDLKYLECVIKESIRLYPPVPFIARHCDEETIVGNLILPKDSNISMHIFDIHRNEKHFPNPDKFDPDRFLPENSMDRHPFAFIPFSAGPRNCIGQKFAMLEIKVLLTNLLKNYKLYPVTRIEDIIFESGLVLRSQNPIEIKVKARI